MKQVNLLINTVLDWKDGAEPLVERLLWIDHGGNSCALIQLNRGNALPYLRRTSEVLDAVSSGEACVIEDPLKRPRLREHEIPEKHRKTRDHRWEVIAPLIEGEKVWRLFDPHTRGPLVAARERELKESEDKKKRATKKHIYSCLRTYWQGGQTKNAIIPLYENSGARGVPRHKKAKDYKKLGRKKDRTKADPEREDLGVNVNKRTHRYILLGAKQFYERHTPKLTLREAHEETLSKFFNRGYGLPRAPWVPIPPAADEAPTLGQFIYHYRLNRKLKRMLLAREGKHAYKTKHRPVLGDSTQAAAGPGTIFQVDATLADVYLCSSLEPSWIVGRPIVYIVVDVFSRLIVGLSVGLEGPSWETACLALLNVVADKVEFCRKYGIRTTKDEWPSCHLPDQLLADRGEFEGYNADNLVNNLHTEVLNTPAYTPDWKGIVEQQFNMIKQRVSRRSPGYVCKRSPGEPRCELDAALNIHEFRRLMISYVIEHNLERRLTNYPMSREMIAAGVEPYPINVWDWGVKNLSGAPRKRDADLVRINLLPEGEASIQKGGLIFKDAKYSCPYLIENDLFVQAGLSGEIAAKVSYDPRLREPIYLHVDGGRRLEPCHLTDRDKRFSDCDLYETEDYFARKDMQDDASKTREYRARAEHSAYRKSITEEAKKRRDKAASGLSDRERLRGKAEKRRAEAEHLRQTEGRGQAGDAQAPARVLPFDREDGRSRRDEDDYIGPATYTQEISELDERSDRDGE